MSMNCYFNGHNFYSIIFKYITQFVFNIILDKFTKQQNNVN